MVATEAGVELESFEWNAKTGECKARYDRETTSASLGVVATLSKLREVCPTDLEPIQSYVDTDSLDVILEHPGVAEEISVTFPVIGYVVTVEGSGDVTVTADERWPDEADGWCLNGAGD